jgi:hypothetical protein
VQSCPSRATAFFPDQIMVILLNKLAGAVVFVYAPQIFTPPFLMTMRMVLFIASLRKLGVVLAVIVNTEVPVPQLAVLGSGNAGRLITTPVISGFWAISCTEIARSKTVRIFFIEVILKSLILKVILGSNLGVQAG